MTMKISSVVKTNPPGFAIISHHFHPDVVDIYASENIVEIFITTDEGSGYYLWFTEEDLQFFLDTIAMMKQEN